MRAVVFAYSSMGVAGIEALLRHGFTVVKVYTHEDDPGENVWFESVAKLCEAKGLPFAAPVNVNEPAVVEEVKALSPEIMFSFYYRKMLRPELLKIPPRGALNLHGSLLPKYRGRCPVNWVLIKGERKTGVTLHYMVEKPDAGDMAGQAEVEISREDTARTLCGKMVRAAECLLNELLPLIKAGRAPRIPLDLTSGSYYGGRKPEDGRINWGQNCWEIYNLIRAVTRPYPGAFAYFLGEKFLVWWATPEDSAPGLLDPGELDIENGKVFVGTHHGSLSLLEAEWRGRVLQGPELAEALAPHTKERFT